MSEYSEAIKRGLKPQINTGTASTAAATINTTPGAKAMKLFNRDDSEDLLYSLDGGTTYLACPPLTVVDEAIEATSILLATAANTAVYDLKVALSQ